MSGARAVSSVSRTGTLVGLTFLVFLVLKLTGVIDWSWWWVTSPLWLAALATVAGLLLGGVIGFAIYRIVRHIRRKRAS